MSNSNAPMTNADWLRASAGWTDGKQFDMLDARHFEESADEIESLRADNARLREALTDIEAAAEKALKFMADIGEYPASNRVRTALRAALAKAAKS